MLSIEDSPSSAPNRCTLSARPAQSAMALTERGIVEKIRQVAAVTGVDDTWLDKQVDMQTTVEDKLKPSSPSSSQARRSDDHRPGSGAERL